MQFKHQDISSNKKYIRKILLIIIIFTTLSSLVWYGWHYTKLDNFPIKHVKIFATYEHVEQKPLQDTIDDYLNNGFFYLNALGMKQKLLELPWIYAVSIQREWPDTIKINIAEQQAILQWGTKALINSKGTIFTPPITTFPKNLPIIFGPKEQEPEIFTLYQKIGALLEPLGLAIKKLILNPKHHWEILLSNDTMIYLKEKDPLIQIKLLVDIYKKITADRDQTPKSIDLRYHTGLAVKWE